MTINIGEIRNLLWPGLAAIAGMYNKYPSQWAEIFDVYHSDKYMEVEAQMKFLGLAQIRPEGAATAMDDMGQRYLTNYFHRYVGLGFIITLQAMDDNLYEDKFPRQAQALMQSLGQVKEILGASILNNAFNTAFPIGDGQPVCSETHPIDGGYLPNTGTAASLSETSLEQAVIGIQQFQDQAGLIVMIQPRKLIVGPNLQFQSARLLESRFRTDTANNDISAIYNLSAIPEGYRVNQFLNTNPNAWFIKTDCPDGFKHYIRNPIRTDVYADFSTDNLQAKAIERYSFGITDPRGVWGNIGA